MEDPEARFMKFREAVFEAWKERKSIAVFGEPGSSFGTNWRLGPDKDYNKPIAGTVYVRDSNENRALWIMDQPWSSKVGNELVTAAIHRINSKMATDEDWELIKDITGQNTIEGLIKRWEWFYKHYGDKIIKEAHDLVVPPEVKKVVEVVEEKKEEKPVEKEKIIVVEPEGKPIYKSRTVIGNVVAAILIPIFVQQFGMSTEEAAVFASAVFALLNMFFRAITDKPVR